MPYTMRAYVVLDVEQCPLSVEGGPVLCARLSSRVRRISARAFARKEKRVRCRPTLSGNLANLATTGCCNATGRGLSRCFCAFGQSPGSEPKRFMVPRATEVVARIPHLQTMALFGQSHACPCAAYGCVRTQCDWVGSLRSACTLSNVWVLSSTCVGEVLHGLVCSVASPFSLESVCPENIFEHVYEGQKEQDGVLVTPSRTVRMRAVTHNMYSEGTSARSACETARLSKPNTYRNAETGEKKDGVNGGEA